MTSGKKMFCSIIAAAARISSIQSYEIKSISDWPIDKTVFGPGSGTRSVRGLRSQCSRRSTIETAKMRFPRTQGLFGKIVRLRKTKFNYNKSVRFPIFRYTRFFTTRMWKKYGFFSRCYARRIVICLLFRNSVFVLYTQNN